MKRLSSKVISTPTNSGFMDELAQSKKKSFISGIGNSVVSGLKKRSFYIEFICAVLIILLIYTGLHKIVENDKFKFEMGRSPYIQNFKDIIAVTLPPGELLIALALIFKRTRLIGLMASFGIMVLFTGYVFAMINFAYYVPCSCGGIISALSWGDHLILNSILTAIALIGVILQSKQIAYLNSNK